HLPLPCRNPRSILPVPLPIPPQVSVSQLGERRASGLGRLCPVAADALPVGDRPDTARVAVKVVPDGVGEQHVPTAEPLGEVAALEDFVLHLPVELDGEPLLADLPPALVAVLVAVAHPPSARGPRTLEDAAVLPGVAHG